MRKKLYVIASLFLASTALVGLASCDPAGTSQTVGDISINVSGKNEVEVGKTITLRITLQNDTNKKGYTTESSDTSIATVNNNVVTGVKEGTCNIIVTAVGDTSVKKEYAITVKKAVDTSSISVTISGDKTSIKVNEKIQLTAEVEGAGEATLSYRWTSVNRLTNISSSRNQTCEVTGNTAGSEVISLEVTIGTEKITKTYNLNIEEDYSTYTEIATKEDFMSKIINAPSPNLTGKYYLSADIDLGGEKIDGFVKALNLSGTLDGKGHTLSNFEIISTDKDKANSALIQSVSSTGRISNLHVIGTIGQQGAGWGTATLVNVHSGLIENCLVETKQEYNQGSDGWFPFNASICGVLKEESIIRNCVVNVTSSCEAAGVNMAIAAYPAGGSEGLKAQTTQTFKVSNVYTNQPESSTLGSVWEWGSPIEDKSSVYCSINFANTAASKYDALDETVWNLVDNKMPTLKVID